MELAGVWSEAAPLGGFGVPGELLCSAFNHSSCTPGPERRARPSLLPPHQLSATPARLRAKPGGPVHRNASQGEGSHPIRTPAGLLGKWATPVDIAQGLRSNVRSQALAEQLHHP